MPEEKPVEKKSVERYSVQEIATQSEPRISDGEKIYTMEEALVLALNKLDNMEKKIVG